MSDAGIVILLFLAGLVPFSSVLFLLLALCALSSYIQYNANALVRQEPEQQSTNTTGLPAQLSSERAERTRQWHMANMMMMGTVGGLSMMNRDFNESGKVVLGCYMVLGSLVQTKLSAYVQTTLKQQHTVQTSEGCTHDRSQHCVRIASLLGMSLLAQTMKCFSSWTSQGKVSATNNQQQLRSSWHLYLLSPCIRNRYFPAMLVRHTESTITAMSTCCTICMAVLHQFGS